MNQTETCHPDEEELLQAPDPVTLQLRSAGQTDRVRVVTDRPPPVRERCPPRRTPVIIQRR